MKITPQYSYLPYNLGLVYQRLNRRSEAEDVVSQAMSLAPDSAEPLNALGSLKAPKARMPKRRNSIATRSRRIPNLLPARHNLALLLSTSKDRQAEAIGLWKQNLAAKPDFLPSRLALAGLLADTWRHGGAHRRVPSGSRPRARVHRSPRALAAQLVKAEQPDAALEQLHAAVKLDPADASLYEQIGDVGIVP